MEESTDTIFEERDELVVLPGGGDGSDISLRTAHFLKPTTKTPFFQLPSHSISAKSATLKEFLPLDVSFKGWRMPLPKWRDWVDHLHSKHQSLWRKVGIYEAIMGSRCWIGKNREVVLALAEKWCPETNSFMFPWGEATITLEDMLILGGYPVLGYPFSIPLVTDEQRKTHEKLIKLYTSCRDSKQVTHHTWLKIVMGSGREPEHEAFLSFWLSKYVFPTSYQLLQTQVFSIAIHLARGTTIALAPAVLSSIYRDLGFLKQKLVVLDEHKTSENLILYAPFQLLLLWAWERFPSLRPTPKALASSNPRAARWDGLKTKVSVKSARLAIDSAGESFQWRPYTVAVKNWTFPNCYGDEEQWIVVGPGLEEEFESVSRCLRASELVGVGCIQQYLPHRVALQFGLDQDIPGLVGRQNDSPEIAWWYYDRPIRDAKIYVPPRICRGDVTLQYSEWWKQLAQGTRPEIKHYSRRPSNPVSPQDLMNGGTDIRSPTMSSSALVCHQSKVGEGNNQEATDLTHVDSAGKDLDIDVQQCYSSGCQITLTCPASDVACTKMKQVTEMEGIEASIFKHVLGNKFQGVSSSREDDASVDRNEDVFRSVVTRKRSIKNRKRPKIRPLALILQEHNKKNDHNVAFHPKCDETKEENGLAEGVLQQTCEKILGEKNQDVPSGFARTTIERKECDFVVKVETNEQINSDEKANLAGRPNHVAAPAQTPEVANTRSGAKGENPEAETLFGYGGEGMDYRVKIPGLKLEAMIAALEVRVAALKAARLNNIYR